MPGRDLSDNEGNATTQRVFVFDDPIDHIHIAATVAPYRATRLIGHYIHPPMIDGRPCAVVLLPVHYLFVYI
jgi:hypothetical protein